jgi:hypothetical protein
MFLSSNNILAWMLNLTSHRVFTHANLKIVCSAIDPGLKIKPGIPAFNVKHSM